MISLKAAKCTTSLQCCMYSGWRIAARRVHNILLDLSADSEPVAERPGTRYTIAVVAHLSSMPLLIIRVPDHHRFSLHGTGLGHTVSRGLEQVSCRYCVRQIHQLEV